MDIFRWCLGGRPLINGLLSLYGLFRLSHGRKHVSLGDATIFARALNRTEVYSVRFGEMSHSWSRKSFLVIYMFEQNKLLTWA